MTVTAAERKGKQILGIGLAIYLLAFVVGAVVAGKASSVAILFGGLVGFVSCAVVLRTIVMVIAIRRRRPSSPFRSSRST